MPSHDIVVIGASAGGVEALTAIVSRFPVSLPAAVFVVIHLSEGFPSALPNILKRAGPLTAAHPKDGDQIESGRIYVAPPEFHMLLKPGTSASCAGRRRTVTGQQWIPFSAQRPGHMAPA